MTFLSDSTGVSESVIEKRFAAAIPVALQIASAYHNREYKDGRLGERLARRLKGRKDPAAIAYLELLKSGSDPAFWDELLSKPVPVVGEALMEGLFDWSDAFVG